MPAVEFASTLNAYEPRMSPRSGVVNAIDIQDLQLMMEQFVTIV